MQLFRWTEVEYFNFVSVISIMSISDVSIIFRKAEVLSLEIIELTFKRADLTNLGGTLDLPEDIALYLPFPS